MSICVRGRAGGWLHELERKAMSERLPRAKSVTVLLCIKLHNSKAILVLLCSASLQLGPQTL